MTYIMKNISPTCAAEEADTPTQEIGSSFDVIIAVEESNAHRHIHPNAHRNADAGFTHYAPLVLTVIACQRHGTVRDRGNKCNPPEPHTSAEEKDT